MDEKKKILVVEDNQDLLEIVCTYLSSHYSQIRSAENLRHAAEIIRNWHPDVVLADFHLPDAKATELLEDDENDTPERFLVMTGDLRQADDLEERHGVDKVLYKPFRLNELLDAITNGDQTHP